MGAAVSGPEFHSPTFTILEKSRHISGRRNQMAVRVKCGQEIKELGKGPGIRGDL